MTGSGQGRPSASFHEAAVHGALDHVRRLIAAGEDVSAVDATGATPLHLACQQGHLEVARVLVDAGAPVDPEDRFGNTPLWRAVFAFQGGEPALIRLLLDAGADPDRANRSGRSPRDMALAFDRPGIRSVLPGPGGELADAAVTRSESGEVADGAAEAALQAEVRVLVRGGFHTPRQIVDDVVEAEGDHLREDVERAVSAAIRELEEERRSWPARTDNDRLAGALEDLAAHGVIALDGAGVDQEDGYTAFQARLQAHPAPSEVRGYCFYDVQDVARAVTGGGLFLAFGPRDPREEQTVGPQVGEMVADALRVQGLKVAWDGTFDHRIHLPAFDWKRR